jgi:hypothetical protein
MYSCIVAVFGESPEPPVPGPTSQGEDDDPLIDNDDASTDLEKQFEIFESQMAGFKKQNRQPHSFNNAIKTKGNPWERQ